ncbi:RagB/SusD family nutrient uptake outer membrane protein [Rubrivirga sp. IMCC45206]|uniref:RagB/SusD family nutrient uptake outer membrane protein n=1 Tax=Rubrivirga sp. IMCC45206 TaxID=3391614 RepID=UPI00398FBCCB
MTTTTLGGRIAPALVLTLGLALALGLTACDLTVDDPNATTEVDAFNTRDGLLAAAAGLQAQYNDNAFGALALTTGITSRELAADNTFANLLELDAGGAALDPSNANLTGYFREMYQTIGLASQIIEGAQATATVEDALRARLTALGEFYKGAAIGALALGFSDVALDVSADGPVTYVGNQAAFAAAADLMEAAEGRLAGAAASAAFDSVVPDGFDLLNSVRAYRARYALLAGDLDEALAAANRVDPAATSVFAYDGSSPNPLYRAISPDFGQPSFAVRIDLGVESAEADDGRIAYFTQADTMDVSVNGYPIGVATGFIVGGDGGPLPVYIPDEMVLIRAEVLARQGDTAGAVAAIDAVRTDTDDPFGLAAGLAPYAGATSQQALLDEIYRNRALELYLQGLRLADARRLGQGAPDTADPFQRTRNFYPFPRQERLSNPDTTPADPAI